MSVCRLFFGEQGAPQETHLASAFRQDLKPHQLQVIRYPTAGTLKPCRGRPQCLDSISSMTPIKSPPRWNSPTPAL